MSMHSQISSALSPVTIEPLVRGTIAALSHLRETLDVYGIISQAAAGLTAQLPPDGTNAVKTIHEIRIVVCANGKVMTRNAASKATLCTVDPARALVGINNGDIPVLIGLDASATLWIGILTDQPDGYVGQIQDQEHSGEVSWVSMRNEAHLFDDNDVQCGVSLTALSYWHSAMLYCSACGQKVSAVHCGWVRQCQGCERLEYPRQDPAMIVAVLNRRDEILLAHNALWEPRKVSVLAGFVDAGESPQRAVERELAEEVGIRVRDVEFVGSQPWPFPRSLMLGYFAHTEDEELHPDGREIEWAQWVSRRDLPQEVAAGRLILPGVNTIAYGLISRWYGASLPGGES